MKHVRLWTSIVFALAFVMGMYIFGRAIVHRNVSNQTVTVKGLSERNFDSDLIVWRSTFSVQYGTLKEAYSALVPQKELVLQYLKNKGIKSEEIVFSAVNIVENYDVSYQTDGSSHRTFNGYILSQICKVTSSDVPKVEAASRDISDLIDQGVVVHSHSPEYYYTKLSDLKVEMLREASEDAYHRAQTMAEGGRGHLGSLVRSTQGVFQINSQHSSEEYSWGGNFNTSSFKKTASVTVSSTYRLK